MEVHQRFAAFSKPFVLATRNVFSTMLSAELKTQKPGVKKQKNLPGDISTLMEISGNLQTEQIEKKFKSLILISWPMPTYLKMAGAMLMAEYTEFSEDIAEVGVEMANIIMTNVKKDLKDLGYNGQSGNAKMIQGQDHVIPYPQDAFIVSVPIECEHGPFTMEFCYQEDQ